MFIYYYLKPEDIIKEGDQYNTSIEAITGWSRCTNSIGYTSGEYARELGGPWVVRRKTNKTKLGNSL